VAERFEWPFGSKRIINHKERLGLKNHILSCGDLSEEYEAVIVLEDDLIVSRYFYQYAVTARDFYAGDETISGISLYGQRYNETASRPFEAFEDGYDVYFLQLASSWGQLWTASQWRQFRHWYADYEEHSVYLMGVPSNISKWPASSWKKNFIEYMISCGKYFVYPRVSLTTNFCDPGAHYQHSTMLLQVPLLLGAREYRFVSFMRSHAVYDAFMELSTSSIQHLNQDLSQYDFEVDLYGSKPANLLKTKPYALTTRSCRQSLQSYKRETKPHETGVLMNMPGHEIHLCDTKAEIFLEFRPDPANHAIYDSPYISGRVLPRSKNKIAKWIAEKVATSVMRKVSKIL